MALIEEIDESDQQQANKAMTEEERLALAEKLDKELDEFIDSLEKRGYTEGWPEDRWEEEMEKHPFFMKNPPKEGDDLHPLLEGIQQLKYDPLENTLEDLAATYKNDGNFDMKNKKYRMAIFSYTEGIRQKCINDELNASLHNNRSAANFFLKNYRSSLFDAKKAAQLKPSYEKAELRIVQCLYHLSKYEECIDYCKTFIDKYGQNEKVLDIRTKARQAHLEQLRNERKKQNEHRRKGETLKRTIDELKKRGIKFEEQLKTSRIESLIRPKLLPLEDFPIEINDAGHLRWPAVFCYPEFVICDFQQQLEDPTVLHDVLCDLFAEPMDQDRDHKYTPDNVNVYYEHRLAGTLHKVDVNKTIKQITSEKNFYVGGGVLTFHIVVKNSDAEREFVDQKRMPLILPPQ